MPAHPPTVDFLSPDDIPVRIVRSVKRKKTISARWDRQRLLVQVPAALDANAERMLVDEMVKKYRSRKERSTLAGSDEALAARAGELDARYFGGDAAAASVRWVGNQNKRWGSASTHSRTIRLSTRLQHTPQWVQDYVLVHELAHLVVPGDGHGARFQRLLNRFERRAEADLYLEAFSAGYRAHAGAAGEPEDDADGFGDDEL